MTFNWRCNPSQTEECLGEALIEGGSDAFFLLFQENSPGIENFCTLKWSYDSTAPGESYF
jgi:hypothetical protein